MTKFTIDPEYLEKYKNADWMETHTGRKFFPAAPKAEDLTIFDIAHALSLKCRYSGHTKSFYSVAEHSVSLALYARYLRLPAATQFHFLMHDGNEAYLPDVCRPIKHFFPDLIIMEKNLDATIRAWCDLDQEVPAIVKEFDSRIIRDERTQVMMASPNAWQTDALQPLGVVLHGYLPAVAEARFLQAYQTIAHEHLGTPALLAYDDGQFMGNGRGSSDVAGFIGPNIHLLDLRGNCALARDENGIPYYINGDFNLIYQDLNRHT